MLWEKKMISIWDVSGKAVVGKNGGLLFYIVWLRQPHYKRDLLLFIFTSFIVFELEIPHSSAFCPSLEKNKDAIDIYKGGAMILAQPTS